MAIEGDIVNIECSLHQNNFVREINRRGTFDYPNRLGTGGNMPENAVDGASRDSRGGI
jgi:hypothetical protein